MATTTTAASVGQRLVDLCREGKNMEAVKELYADNIVSIEAVAMEGMPQRMEGRAAIEGKHTWWEENNEVHSAEVHGPFPHGDDRFAVVFKFETTFKPTGQRQEMNEVAVYTLADGKIVKEEFFYQM